jgi:hypothetical protein
MTQREEIRKTVSGTITQKHCSFGTFSGSINTETNAQTGSPEVPDIFLRL